MLVRTDFRTFRPKTINGAHVRATTCHVECEERNVLGAWFYHAGHVYVTDYRFPHWVRALVRKKNKQPSVRVSGVRNRIKSEEIQHSSDGQFSVKNTVTTYELGNYLCLVKKSQQEMVAL